MVAYALALSAALTWGGFGGSSPARFAWAVLPVLPMIWVAIAVARHVHRIDEYERGKQLSGLAVGFAVAMLSAIALGILESAGLRLTGSTFWVYGAGMVTWALSAAVSSRR
jgi:hypothetical protein